MSRSPARPAAWGGPPPGRLQAPRTRAQAAPLGTSHNGAVMGRGPGSRPLRLNVAKAAPQAFPRSRFYITGVLCKLAPPAGAFRRPTSGPPHAAPVRPQGLPVKTTALGLQSSAGGSAFKPGWITRPPEAMARQPQKARVCLAAAPVRPPGLPELPKAVKRRWGKGLLSLTAKSCKSLICEF